ncbi:ligand-binding sensor domain-containing protein [Paracnuella aquatica]|uniref:ligand-binding sensor domain-containing protein n=1 Tax=Paracnuella aquatica TaxID=2268757 RepID=UPI000DEF6CCB|nr:two-component regulator propeller domain-containing protein [Paracnuella aquatica]RPD45174.1 hypothetical protein DRJ53_16180 [Paracnuella aquatica]
MPTIIRLLLVLLLFASTAFGQEARQYAFRHLTTASGLASNLVNGAVQDRDGYLWVATLNGLQRYDGFNFLLFTHQPGSLSSLPANSIASLFADKQQQLWVITHNNDIGIFDTRKFRFRRALVQGLPPQTYFSAKYLFNGGDGNLYLHEANRRIFRYDSVRNRFVPADQLLPEPAGWQVNKIVWDNQRKCYWATADSALLQFTPANRKLQVHGYNGTGYPKTAMRPTAGPYMGVHAGSNGVVSFFTWAAGTGMPVVHQFLPEQNRHSSFLIGPALDMRYHEINMFYEQRNGRQWIGGNPLLIEMADSGTKLLPVANGSNSNQNIRFDRANGLFEDREGNLWISTDNGLFYFNPDAQLFETYGLLRPGGSAKEGPVQTVLETADRIFVGCWGVGLYCYDKKWNPLPVPKALLSFADNGLVWDLHQHSRTGKIWLAMQNGELHIYDPVKETKTTIKPPEFNGRTIRQVAEDDWGNLWFGTQGGHLVKWEYKRGGSESSGYKLVMQTGLVHKIEAHKGFVWVATSGHGLLQVAAQTDALVRTYGERGRMATRISSGSPSDIIVYNDSTLVVLAGSINIINLKKGTVQQLGTAQGVLPSNSAVSGRRDAQGILWVGMANGLCRVNLQQRTHTFYDRRDGISYDNFPLASAFGLSDGRMVFVTDHNFVVFNPEKASATGTPHQPQLTGLTVGDQSLLLDSLRNEERLVLPYHKNSLSFAFSSLHFAPGNKLQYFYQLEGLNKDWIPAGNKPEALFSYLPPGSYQLRLRTENGDGVASPEFRLFPVVIRPPFWQSWWFYSVLALIIAGAVVWFDRERMRRLRAVQQTRLQIAGNLHEELNTALHHINILSEMARIKSGQDLQQSLTYLDQISERSHNMIILMDDMIWSIDPSKDTLQDTLVRLQEFVAALQSRYEALISVAVGKKVPFLKLDMKKRHEAFVVIKELLRLAVEQGGARNVLVNMNLVKGRLVVKFYDEGVTLQGQSLHAEKKVDELRKRITAVGGELDFQVREQVLSVILMLPV